MMWGRMFHHNRPIVYQNYLTLLRKYPLYLNPNRTKTAEIRGFDRWT